MMLRLANRGGAALLQQFAARQAAFQSTSALAKFDWDDWSNYLASDQVKADYTQFKADFTHMKKSIVDNAKDPVAIQLPEYEKVLGKQLVQAIVKKMEGSAVAIPSIPDWQSRAATMLSSHKQIALEVDTFNEVEYKDALRWASMLDTIEANIDTVSVDEVLACFPETAEQIDDDIEEYWWRPEDKVEFGSHSGHH